MGFAIAGMHYTAMAAAHFTAAMDMGPPCRRIVVGTTGLAVPVVMGAFVILTLTVAGSITDHWVRAKLATPRKRCARAKSDTARSSARSTK